MHSTFGQLNRYGSSAAFIERVSASSLPEHRIDPSFMPTLDLDIDNGVTNGSGATTDAHIAALAQRDQQIRDLQAKISMLSGQLRETEGGLSSLRKMEDQLAALQAEAAADAQEGSAILGFLGTTEGKITAVLVAGLILFTGARLLQGQR